jgi:WD40 repeat protein
VSPVRTLAVGNELGFVVPLPGHRLCTVCPEAKARHPLMVWDLETGNGEAHRVDGLPSCVTWLDDQSYVVGTMDAKMTIRRLDTGKLVGKLYGWENHDGGGIRKFAVGNEGKLFAALYDDGTLMFWGLSEGRNRGLGRHAQAAPPAIVADPGSSWVITPSPEEVLTWKEGQPARSLVGSGPVEVRPEQPGDGTELGARMVEQVLAVFVRPNVVAIGGAHLDVWDLGTSRHLGRWDKPVTTLISVCGKVIAGDNEGNIWEVNA